MDKTRLKRRFQFPSAKYFMRLCTYFFVEASFIVSKKHIIRFYLQHFVRRYRGLHSVSFPMHGSGVGQASQRIVRQVRPASQRKFYDARHALQY